MSSTTVHDTILLVGGNFEKARNFETIAYNKKTITPSLVNNIPPLPKKSVNTSLLISEENNLMSLGGNMKNCFILKSGQWTKHSRLNINRFGGVFINMPNGIYVFGGNISPNTTEFLPKGTDVWQFGPELKLFEEKGSTYRERTFTYGNGHKVSEEDIILIKRNLVINFNVRTNLFTHLSEIEHNHFGGCASVFYNGQVIITGGQTYHEPRDTIYVSYTTRIYDLKSKTCRLVGSLNVPRSLHKMAVISLDNKLKVIAFGGYGKNWSFLSSVELFDEVKETWTMLDAKMKIGRQHFAHVEVSSTFFHNLN